MVGALAGPVAVPAADAGNRAGSAFGRTRMPEPAKPGAKPGHPLTRGRSLLAARAFRPSPRHAVHVTNYRGAMHFYPARRLFAPPLQQWVVGMLQLVATFSTIVWTRFDLETALAVFAALVAITASVLFGQSHATIEVDGAASCRRRARRALPLTQAGEVRPLDAASGAVGPARATRRSPRAYLLIRTYLHYAVYVRQVAASLTGLPVLAAEGQPRQPARLSGCNRKFTPRGEPRRRGHDMIASAAQPASEARAG